METLTHSLYQVRKTGTRIQMPMIISDAFIAKILTPYKENAKYLKSARIVDYYDPGIMGQSNGDQKAMVTIEGIFSIAESCYIDDTGHFNAVEFNICYNQLAYVLFGKCIQSGIFQKVVPDWEDRVNLTYESFLKYQLSSMFIAKIEGNFLKPLNARNFHATLTIMRIMWTNQTAFVHTANQLFGCKGSEVKRCCVACFQNS